MKGVTIKKAILDTIKHYRILEDQYQRTNSTETRRRMAWYAQWLREHIPLRHSNVVYIIHKRA